MSEDAYDSSVRQKTQNKKKTTRLASSGWEHYWLQGFLISLWSSHKLPPKPISLLECCALSPAPSVSEAIPGIAYYCLWRLSLRPPPRCSEQRLFALFPPLTRSPLRCSPIFAAAYIPLLVFFHFLFPNNTVNSVHLFCLVLFYPFQEFGLCRPRSHVPTTTRDPIFLLL